MLIEYFHLSHFDNKYRQRYNIAPSQEIAIIRQNALGERYLEHVRWGLIPSWAKDRGIGNKLVNARAETVDEKPAFRTAFKKRRCLIPADGFYEWKREDGKQPFRIVLPSNEPMAFAGLWEHWESPESGELIESCTILTTLSNQSLHSLHDRMPVILQPEAYPLWLDQQVQDTVLLKDLLRPFPGNLTVYAVSRALNSPANDTRAVMERIELDTP